MTLDPRPQREYLVKEIIRCARRLMSTWGQTYEQGERRTGGVCRPSSPKTDQCTVPFCTQTWVRVSALTDQCVTPPGGF